MAADEANSATPTRNRGCRKPRRPGFTLLEVLVAFTISSLALAVLFRSAIDSLQATETAGYYEEALARARSHLAGFGQHPEALVPGDSDTDDGKDGAGHEFHLHVSIRALDHTGSPRQISRYKSTRAAGRHVPPTTLYDIEIVESWQQDGRTREYVLDSARIGLSPAAVAND